MLLQMGHKACCGSVEASTNLLLPRGSLHPLEQVACPLAAGGKVEQGRENGEGAVQGGGGLAGGMVAMLPPVPLLGLQAQHGAT